MESDFAFEPIVVADRSYGVEIVETSLKNAYARLEEKRILIRIPKRYPRGEKAKVATILYNKIKKAMLKRPIEQLIHTNKKIKFYDGQNLSVANIPLRVEIRELVNIGRKSVRVKINATTVKVVVRGPIAEEGISRSVRKGISKWAKPLLLERIRNINNAHFKSNIGEIKIRENDTNWGSCTRGNNNLSFNFKLLFLPERILDYVIVHELAHTKIRAHSDRFWSLVAEVMPDYKENKKWLRENGNSAALNAAGFTPSNGENKTGLQAQESAE